MRTILCIATLGLLAACVPDDHPPWLVDHPMSWGIIASVVEPGGYSSDLIVPDGHVRAAALPFDTLELQWLTVAPPGPELAPPIWIVCDRKCALQGPNAAVLEPTCPDPLPLSRARSCRLGQGQTIRLTLGSAFTADDLFRGHIQVLGIASADPDLDPETCLQRIVTSPPKDLERCLIQQRTLTLGPPWKLFTDVPALAKQFTVEGEIPDDLTDEPADTHPILTGLHVLRRSSRGAVETIAPVDATVRVRPGERITVTPQFTADSAQPFYEYRLLGDDRIKISSYMDNIWLEAALTALVDDYELSPNNDVQWIAPADPQPLTLHLLISDSRQGYAQATLTFITDDAIPAP